jgi:site-specific recombinase XerD
VRKPYHNSKGFRGAAARNASPALHLAPEPGETARANSLPESGAGIVRAFPPRAQGNPARVYLWQLAPAGRRSTEARLSKFAELLGFTLDSYRWAEMTPADVLTARALLRETGAGAASVNMTLSALRSVARTCRELGLEEMSAERCAQVCEVKGVKGSSLPAGRALPRAEVDLLLEVCRLDHSPAGERDLALLALLYYGGLRRDEACLLQPEDYRRRDHSLRVLGKGSKEEFVYLEAKEARLALNAWMRRRAAVPGPLFCSLRRGGKMRLDDARARPLTGDAVYKIVRRRAAAAGIAPCTPHDLRRSAITNLLEGGADPLAVKEWARHTQVATTTVYDRRRERAKRACARRLGPPPIRVRTRRKPHRPKRGRPRLAAPLESMRKDMLLRLAHAHGVEASPEMTRGEIARLIRAAVE